MIQLVAVAASASAAQHIRVPAIVGGLTVVVDVIGTGVVLARRRGRSVRVARRAVTASDTRAPTAREVLSRAVGVFLVAVLIALYLLAVVPTVAALPLVFGLDSSVAITPGGQIYHAAGLLLSIALGLIALRYAYYYWCWFTSRRYFRRPEVIEPALLAVRELPNIKVQVTTKGGALPVVERSLRELERSCVKYPWLAAKLLVEVISEDARESARLEAAFAGSVLEVSAIVLPEQYRTPRGTLLKARALHYMVEQRRRGLNHRPGTTYIVHFDEETMIEEEHLLTLVDYLSDAPRPVSQGPILYPLEWTQTPLLCRALESMRPFGCSECARVMQHPPPPHLHGSNLVVEESVENEIGWDLGTLRGQPYVAEDLLFGLRAYSVLGDQGFGWHGATMLEQPPLTLYWAVQQRLRWVLGALQGLHAMTYDDGYSGISPWHRRRLFVSIGARIATYCLGYPLGFAGLYFLFRPAHVGLQPRSPLSYWHVLVIAAGVGWLVSYQIGLARNLRYQQLGLFARVVEHVGMLFVTPLAGLCETVGPFVAVLRWLAGYRRARWTPTPKLAEVRGHARPEGLDPEQLGQSAPA